MNAVAEPIVSSFVDRRNYETGVEPLSRERRQFTNSHEGLSPEARSWRWRSITTSWRIVDDSSRTKKC